MSIGTGIEWTEATWNPVTGCDRVSEGCDHCYALTLAKRLKAMGNARYQHDGDPKTSGPGFGVTLHEDQLDLPRSLRRPRLIFVNSMSDMFHESVPDEFIDRAFGVMRETPWHTYQTLTKRAGRMASLLSKWAKQGHEPPPNLWLGVSVENQRWADIRIPKLLQTPAAIRFLSCEPLIGAIKIGPSVRDIDWVIVGGESGPGHRPMDPSWPRDLRDECDGAGVPFFFKQWGGATPKAGGRHLAGRTWDEMPTRGRGAPADLAPAVV